ncbi:MAG: hypothetical protein K8I03_15890 [Ignavibacteria bacterium]|nr:hypothetical protein [Ignavibacteria bacterium]
MIKTEVNEIYSVRTDDFWDDLSDEQKKDLKEAWIESENENNLIDHEKVVTLSRGWLKK